MSFDTTSGITFKKLLTSVKPWISFLYIGDMNNDYLIKLF